MMFKISGADELRIDSVGDLVMKTRDGELRQRRPDAYQLLAGIRRRVEASYVLHGGNRVGFRVGSHDRGADVVLDPRSRV